MELECCDSSGKRIALAFFYLLAATVIYRITFFDLSVNNVYSPRLVSSCLVLSSNAHLRKDQVKSMNSSRIVPFYF